MTLRLRSKILVLFLGLVLVSSAASIGLAYFAVQEVLTKDLLDRIIVNSKSEINDLTNFILIEDISGIINLIYNQKSTHSDISYLLVTDNNGKILASTLVNQNPNIVLTYNSLPLGEMEHTMLIQQEDGQQVYDIALRLDYDKGVLRVGYFKEQIDKSISNIIYALLLGVVFSIVVAALFALLLIRWIVQPIVKLLGQVNKMKDGDLSVRTDIDSYDEVGDLGREFNEMVARLQRTYSTLDSKVKEKTLELSGQIEDGLKSQQAILNLVEDLELEKNKIEKVVTSRTKELSDEKARLLASINSLNFGFVLSDTDDHILIQNPALHRILDLKEELTSLSEIKRISISIINTPTPTPTPTFDPLVMGRQCMELKRTVEIPELSFGSKILRAYCSPIAKDVFGVEGGVNYETIGYILLIEDITEAKILQRSRDEFFAVASHELRTPLTAIRGNTNMILESYSDKITDPDVNEMLHDINESSVRLINIVNDFLEASRLEQGRIDVKLEQFNVDETITKVVRSLEEMINKKGLTLHYETPEQAHPKVFADKERVEQILVNLIGNSIKFTKEGGITIALENMGTLLKIKVTDTGSGISEQNKSLLFRKFQPAGEQTLARDVTQSTGLGLYICRLIIIKMGGTIDIEKSALGVGSTFAFTLPIARGTITPIKS